MLGSLFKSQTIAAIDAALSAAGARAPVVVLGQPRIAAGLAELGRAVVQIAPKPRTLRRGVGLRVYGSLTALPLAGGSAPALVGFGGGSSSAWQVHLDEWSRVITHGGTLVVVDRVPPVEASRRALCAGLVDIQQRSTGRTVITTGMVVHLDAVAQLP